MDDRKERFNPFAKKKADKFELAEWIDFFAERYGWTLEEVLNLPIPTFVALQEAISKKNEREKREMQRKR